VRITLKDAASGNETGRGDVVHVYGGATTTLSWIFGDSDFVPALSM